MTWQEMEHPSWDVGRRQDLGTAPLFGSCSQRCLGRRYKSQVRNGCIHLDTIPCLSAAGPRLSHAAQESPPAPAIPTNLSSTTFPSIFSFLCTCLWGHAQVGMWEIHFPSAGPGGSGCHILGGSQHPSAALHCFLLASSSSCQCTKRCGQHRMGVARRKAECLD